MTVELQTGNQALITSASDSQLYAGMVGSGQYVLDVGSKLVANMRDANTLVIGDGSVMQNGRHVRFLGETEVVIPSGLQSQKRSNLIVLRTTISRSEKDLTAVESSEIKVISGDPVSSGVPEDPEWETGSLLDGAMVADMPLYRVVTDGINALDPVPMFKEFASADTRWDSVYPIGSLYLSFVEKNPSELFGGTWEKLNNVFLRAGNDTNTGGEDTHVLTQAEMPSHNHAYYTYNNVWRQTSGVSMIQSVSWSNQDYAPGGGVCATGGNQPHNNMPRYQNIHVWHRVA